MLELLSHISRSSPTAPHFCCVHLKYIHEQLFSSQQGRPYPNAAPLDPGKLHLPRPHGPHVCSITPCIGVDTRMLPNGNLKGARARRGIPFALVRCCGQIQSGCSFALAGKGRRILTETQVEPVRKPSPPSQKSLLKRVLCAQTRDQSCSTGHFGPGDLPGAARRWEGRNCQVGTGFPLVLKLDKVDGCKIILNY